MQTLLEIRTLALVFASVMIESGNAAMASRICTGIPANDPDPPVVVCEDEDRYSFQIAGEYTEFDKVEWKNRARQLVSEYAIEAGIPAQQLSNANVKFWLSVPESAPADAHGRAVVSAGKFNFVVNLPVALDLDQVTRHQVADLAGQAYPGYLGHRVGSILVKKTASASEEEFLALLKRCGATGTGESAGGWTSVYTADFSEMAVIKRIANDPLGKQHVEGANLNSVFEWIAWRQPVFQFPLAETPAHID